MSRPFHRIMIAEPMDFPTDHRLWEGFVEFVRTSRHVRSNLLVDHVGSPCSNDWVPIWMAYLSGAEAQGSINEKTRHGRFVPIPDYSNL